MKNSAVILSIFAILVITLGVLLITKKVEDRKEAAHVVSSQTASPATVSPMQVSIAASSNLYKVTGSYPQFPQADAAFNQTIATAFSTDVSQFETDANSDYAARQKTMSAADLKSYYGSGPVYTFDLTSTVVQSNADYISVVLRESEYTGGAHPDTNIVTYNYDVKDKKELSLTDFMSLQNASNAAQAQLAPRLAAAANETTLDANTQQMLTEGTDPTVPDNFSNFTFTSDSVTIYFGQYQVAPYVFGEQDVTIPIPAA